jgi:hypothetical protein
VEAENHARIIAHSLKSFVLSIDEATSFAAH